MNKPAPKPQGPTATPLWKQPRPLAAAGGLVGVLALVIGAWQGLFSGGGSPTPQQAEQWVDEYLAREKKETPAQRHNDVEKRISTLAEVMRAPDFSKVAKAKQDAIRNRHHELSDYQKYQAQLEKIDDPQTAQAMEPLRKIHASLTQLEVPLEYRGEWTGTPARDRHNEWIADSEALLRAVESLLSDYSRRTEEGKQELDNAAAPRLPQRARDVLERARKLPDPATQNKVLLPGSRRLTYAAVFPFAGVKKALDDWQRVRKKLEGVAGLGKP